MDELTRERYADWDQPRPKRKLPWAKWDVIEERRRILAKGLTRSKQSHREEPDATSLGAPGNVDAGSPEDH